MTDPAILRLAALVETLEDRIRDLETETSRLRKAHESLAGDVVYLEGQVG